VSNLNTTYIFSLPEGHWPRDKSANSVCSMVLHTLQLPEVKAIKGSRVVNFDCDNCAGQNKNRWVVWFCSFLVFVGLCDAVTLHFMIAGHTKNAADGGFGQFKRAMKSQDVITPQDVNRVLNTCSKAVTGIPSYHVKWVNWKRLLETVYSKPVERISKMHMMSFRQDGVVLMQETSSSPAKEHRLLTEGVDVASFKENWREMITQEAFMLPIKPLEELQQGDMSRRTYLTKHVVDRSYSKVDGFADRYFGDGSGWEEGPFEETVVTQRFTPRFQ